MKDFFDVLSDLLASDLVKENAVEFGIIIVAIITMTVVITVIIFNKLVIPLKLKKSENIMPEYEKILAENQRIKCELKALKRTKEMVDVANGEGREEGLQGWEREFLTRK